MRYTTLTLHPAIDRIVEVERLVPGALLDGKLLRAVPAGKGVNTARSLKALLGPARGTQIEAAVWLGETERAFVESNLKREGIAAAVCPRAALTRVCLTYLARRGRRTQETHIKESMPPPPRNETAALVDFCQTLAKVPAARRIVAVCGSAPPGTPAGALKRVLAALAGKTARARPRALIADTNGPFLVAAAAAGLDGIKGNGEEIGAWLGLDEAWQPGRRTHRRRLVEALHAGKTKGAPGAVLVTLGARGAVFATRDGLWIAPPPSVPKTAVRSATGCGDAATAGWLWALGQVRNPQALKPERALACAVACGTAKLLRDDPGGLSPKQTRKLLKRVHVRALNV